MPLYKEENQVNTIRMKKKSGKKSKNSQERNRWRRVAEQLKETPSARFFTTIYFIQISPLSNNFYLPSSSSSLLCFLNRLTIHFTTILSRLLPCVAEIYSFEKGSYIIANKVTKFFHLPTSAGMTCHARRESFVPKLQHFLSFKYI